MKFEIGHPELMFGSNIESAGGPQQGGLLDFALDFD
jgi:hypothetical protein